MKKVLSLILIIAMLLSMCMLFACTGEEAAQDDASDAAADETPDDGDQPSAEPTAETVNIWGKVDVEVVTAADGSVTYNGFTEDQLNDSLPKQHVPEKIAAGIEVTVALSFFETQEAQNRITFEGIIPDIEKLEGVNLVYADAGGDAIAQINQIENFIEMDPALILCWISDVDTYNAPCEKAKDAGIFFQMQGSFADFEPSGQEVMDQGTYGRVLAEAAIAWLDYRYADAEPGSIHTAFLYSFFSIDNVDCVNSIDEVWAADDRINIVYRHEDAMQIDEGFSAAEEAFTMDPTIKLVQTITPNAAIGANNYIISNPDLNLDEIGICMRGDNDETKALLEQGKTNDGSCFRTKGGAGGNTFWESPYNICINLLTGTVEEPFVYEARFYIDSNFGYSFDSRPAE